MAHYFERSTTAERWRTGSAASPPRSADRRAVGGTGGQGLKFADVLSSALRRCCEGDRPSGALKENDARREFVTRCAAALGRLARRGPASSSAHVEVEVSRALAWLDEPLEKRSRYSRKRLAACLVLRELAPPCADLIQRAGAAPSVKHSTFLIARHGVEADATG